MLTLVTGATGFIGGHLARALLRRGDVVRALVRDEAARPVAECARKLGEAGIQLVTGDLTDTHSLRSAVAGAECVYHCAALVGDWLDPREVRRVNVEGTRSLLAACVEAGVRRTVYVSSLAVLGSIHHFGTDESAPYRYTGDAYSDSKIDSERIVQEFAARGELRAVILRPGYVYGPGDRHVLPRLLENLACGRFTYTGDGSKQLNNLYIEDLEQAAFLAERAPHAAGQAYNLTDGSRTSLREFVTFITGYLGLPAPKRHIRPAVAWAACYGLEALARITRAKAPPLLNRSRMKFLYLNQHYSIEKARRELGYTPRFTYREGLPPTLDWFREAGLLPRGVLERERDAV